jgi:YcxB-like protein
MTGDRQEITFTLDPTDLRRFDEFSRKQRRGLTPRVLLILIIVALLGSLLWGLRIGFYRLDTPRHLWAMVLSHGIPLLAIVFVMFLWKPNYAKLAATLPGFLEPRSVRVSGECLHHQDATGEMSILWHMVKKIDTDADYIYFVFANDNGFLVPRRAFPTPEEAQQFYRTAMTFWKGTDQKSG